MTLQQLLSPLRKAVDEYNMIEDGDKIAVGLSGGKDSLTLLQLLAALRRFYPKKFELAAIFIDSGLDFDKAELQSLADLCDELRVPYFRVETQIGEFLFDIRKEDNPCSLCSKMRRGALNTKAIEGKCNKIALGHHADDLIETLFLSLFYEGRLSTFEPMTYLSRTGITLIRPMLYIEEKNISAFMKGKTILHNPCPVDKFTQREYIKQILYSIREDIPFVKERIHSAICHPERNHLFDDALAKYVRDKAHLNINPETPNT